MNLDTERNTWTTTNTNEIFVAPKPNGEKRNLFRIDNKKWAYKTSE